MRTPIVAIVFLLAAVAVADVTVDTTVDADVDDAACSLREAIVAVNTNGDHHGCVRTAATVDQILFDIGTGTPTITITGTILPDLTGPAIIDGASGGATRVAITSGGGLSTGLSFFGGDATGSVVRNLVISGFGSRELFISNGNDLIVEGNLLGTDPTGTSLVAGSGSGIEICTGFACGASSGHHIGGATAAQRNVIVTGSSVGISIGGSSGNVIRGNFINTDMTGSQRLSGQFARGIDVVNASGNVIGGPNAGEGNVITGFNGITIGGNPALARSSGTVVQGNFIGTDVTGTAAIGSGGDGIVLSHALGTQIGGLVAGEGNLVSGNHEGITGGSSGVSGGSVDDTTVQGNLIGTDASGVGALGNSSFGVNLGDDAVIEGNVIAFNGGDGIEANCGACVQRISTNALHSNGGIGIDLNGGSNGVSANDVGDGDTGPNGRQNFPVLDAVIFPGGTSISGTLDSTASTTFRVEIFASDACDPSGNGEGQAFVGAKDDVTTDMGGAATFTVTLDQSVPAGKIMTATAIAPDGSTSEFSPCTPAPPTTTTTSTTSTSSTTSSSTSSSSSAAPTTSSTSSTTSTSTSLAVVTTSSSTSTSSSTTTAVPTTTTTLVSTCIEPGEPRFPSIRCRLVALRVATADAAALGDLRSKLDRPLGKAIDDTGTAQSFCASKDTKHARQRLKQTIRQLIQYSHRLRGLKARKTAPEAIREPLATQADTIKGDATTLRRALACPTDAT
jgi:CSLREA domain-containing protein